jgi:hypothetical protein
LWWVRDGWSEFTARAWVWATVLIFCFVLVVAFAPWIVLGPTAAADLYGSRALFGTLAAAMGLGTIAGALFAFRVRPARPMLAAFIACIPWPLSIGLFALGAPRPLLAVAFFATGLGLGLFGVLWQTALAQRIPPHALSRVSSYDWMGSLALLPFAYLAVGPIGEALGERLVLGGGAVIGCGLVALGFAIPDVWRLRRLEAPV